MTVIMGIDPGIASTGWGVISRDGGDCKLLGYGCITTNNEDMDCLRLFEIYRGVSDVVGQYQPDVVVLELAPGIRMYHARSGTTGEVRGVVKLALSPSVKVVDALATTMRKKLTGRSRIVGRDGKRRIDDMLRAAVVRYLGLERPPTPIHACEAVAHAICLDIPMPPKTRRRRC